MGEIRKKLLQVLALVAFLIAAGTLGYMVVEGWRLLDAIYMTVTTITTVGFREIHPLSKGGIVFTIFLIVGGVGTMLYALSAGARVILEGELKEIYRRKKLEKKIRELSDHYIVCGYGRMGRIIVRELREERVRCVVIEKTPSPTEENEDILMLVGDSTRDTVLKAAGIEKARGLISVLPSDAENLFVVLSARGLNPDLLIVARAVEEDAEQKLLRAGASKVISPFHIGGLRMAHTVLKPTVVDFIEFTTRSGNIELQMQEITVQQGSELIGLTLEACGMGRDLGVIIVAIKQSMGDTKFNPTYRSMLKAGDTLIALGEKSKLSVIEEMAKTGGGLSVAEK
ncbi:MAG: potassium transporter TrkA [Deltaproteobacteria bacterium RBG_13_52_11b]|nr:MAG: potassium transporter TrkA [Deltaproteobacteria bacterium RBG_13_52_11b]